MSRSRIVDQVYDAVYRQRYHIFALALVAVCAGWFYGPTLADGNAALDQTVIPADTRGYLPSVSGFLSDSVDGSPVADPRFLLVSVVPWLVSAVAGFSGIVMATALLVCVISVAAVSMHMLSSRLLAVHGARSMHKSLAAALASLLYVVNPWVVGRVNDPYLLWGYAALPLVLFLVLELFDRTFRSARPRASQEHFRRVSRRNVICICVLAFVLSSMAVSTAYFLVGLAIVILLPAGRLLMQATVSREKRGRAVIGGATSAAAKYLLLGILFLMCSYHWFVPRVFSLYDMNRREQAVTADDLATASEASSLDRVLLLSSNMNMAVSADLTDRWFYIGGAIVLLVGLYGAIRYARPGTGLILLSIIALCLIYLGLGVRVGLSPYRAIVTSGRIGRMLFVDPSLLLGVVAFALSLFFAFGVHALLPRYATVGGVMIRSLLLIGLLTSIWYHNRPLHAGAAIDTAATAARTQTKSMTSVDTRSAVDAVLPLAEGESRPSDHSAMSYHLSYAQYLLERGLTRDLSRLLATINVDTIRYQSSLSDAQGSYVRELLGLQKASVLRVNDVEGVTYAVSAPRADVETISVAVHSPYGLTTQSALSAISRVDRIGYVYSHDEFGNSISHLRSGDLIETHSFRDVWLSNLEPRYYALPLSTALGHDPYLGWASTSVSDATWQSYLETLAIDMRPFDFEFGAGIAATFPSSALSVAPERMDSLTGESVMNLEAMLRLGLFFQSSDLVRIEARRRDDFDRFDRVDLVPGRYTDGEPRRVTSSGLIEIDQSLPYRMDFLLSGAGVGAVQVRVRFLDEQRRNVGTEYHYRPESDVQSERVRARTTFVSPRGATYLQIELQFPAPIGRSARWRLHDLEITELGKYRVSNTLPFEFTTRNSGTYAVFARVFSSQAGGELEITAGGQRYQIETRRMADTRFVWTEVGEATLSAGVNRIEVRNVHGFNAVNVLAIIPVEQIASTQFPIRMAIKKGLVYFSLEAEEDFAYTGNIQTTRRYPGLSLGHGIASSEGVLSREIEIVKGSEYSVVLRASGHRDRSTIVSTFTNLETGDEVVLEKSILATLPVSVSRPMIGLEASSDGSITRSVDMHEGALPDLQFMMLDPVRLDAGRYRLEIELRSNLSNLAGIFTLRRFDPATIETPTTRIPVPELPCASCGPIDAVSVHGFSPEGVTIRYDPTCSCDWYVYSTGRIGVAGNDEYLIRFDVRSESLHGRHAKFVFLDDMNRIVGTELIEEVPGTLPETWSHYEHIVEVPVRANQMLFQLWGRGDRTRRAMVQMRDLSVLPYKELPMVDVVYVMESDAIPIITVPSGDTGEVVVEASGDGLKRTVKLPYRPGIEPYSTLISLNIDSDRFWRITGAENRAVLGPDLDGFRGSILTGLPEFQMVAENRLHAYIGMVLLPLAFVVAYVVALTTGLRETPVRRIARKLRLW